MSEPRKTLSAASAAVACLLLMPAARGEQVRLTVRGGRADMTDVPVSAEIRLPGSLARVAPERIGVKLSWNPSRKTLQYVPPVPGQVIRSADGKTRLWWVIPRLRAGSSFEWVARFSRTRPRKSDCFAWKDAPARHLDLVLAGKGVARYMYERDTSSPTRAHETYKVYHHVFNLAGDGFITKGPHGLYTHHRGVYIGWNKVGFEGKKYDLWHMKPKAVQLHQRFLGKTAGPVLARSTALVHWKTEDNGKVILSEERETTFFRQKRPTLVLMDFVSTITAGGGDVDLSGDPEHAGFQFRPSNAISGKDEKGKGNVPLGESRKAKYLFHGDGVNPRKEKDLPWVAMNYALGGQPYCVLHMNHADNLKGAVYSAYRDYGRFGAWIRTRLARGETLTLRYRLWIGAEEMPSREECAARYSGFVTPPEVTVSR